jgi:hypothetical protein
MNTIQHKEEIPMKISHVPTIALKVRRLAARIQYSVIALAIINGCPSHALAQDGHSHTAAQQAEMTPEQQSKADTLLKVVRQSTERFKDVSVAKAAGYALQFGCVAGDDAGAMGLHYINGDLVGAGVLDPTRPQIVIYEPVPGGGLKLIGADFLVLADTWNASHSAPTQLMGQAFHLFTNPNRFGLPAFYTLHVWAWKDNPKGAFVNWHPHVSCESFTDQQQ